MRKPITVKQLGNYIKNQFITDPFLRKVLVVGEIVNLRINNYCYFSIKEDDETISCIIFNNNFMFSEGDKVIIEGEVSTYQRDSKYQIRVNNIFQVGSGESSLNLEKLKLKLSEKGYFDIDKKLKIPSMPYKIGLITGYESAAYYDFLKVLNDNNYDCEIFLYTSLVQGDSASDDIVNGILTLNNHDLDLIVITRGGGSKEDLSVFNSEKIADSIYISNIPIISAIGHEIDNTITDLVSDLRLSTPTKAAEYIISEFNSSKEIIKNIYSYNELVINNFFNNIFSKINTVSLEIKTNNPEFLIQKRINQIQILDFNNNLYLDSIINKYYDNVINTKFNISNMMEKKLNKNRVYIKDFLGKIISLKELKINKEYILFNEDFSYKIKVEDYINE